MSSIHVLPRHLINMIAAGEVIERPASVVKELVENSLDAGATSIEVAIEEGGHRLIRVRDDGKGMSAEDLKLAFVPHATSKIAEQDDLFRIHTMGFRGEALASIASVSHAQIVTCPRQDNPAGGGYEVRGSAEGIEPVRPAACAPGTAVSIRDLFYSVPARRKFLRSAQTEFGHISEQLAHLALPRCDVRFLLTHNERVVTNLAATASLAQRVADLFGAELAADLLPLDRAEQGIRIRGLLGRPAASRASTRWQYFFVNGRYVRDRFLAHALKEAYRGLTEPTRFPAAFVFLELDEGEVDVNVHPAKIEVRFRNGQMIHSQLLGVMRELLRKAGPTAGLTFASPAAGASAPANTADDGSSGPAPEEQRRESLKEALADFFRSTPPPQPHLAFAGFHERPADASGAVLTKAHEAAAAEHDSYIPARQAAIGPEEPLPDAPPVALAPALQIHNSYIVTSGPEGIVIIDQHALHERIMYEELTRRLASGSLTSQRLLIPQVLPASAADKARLAEHQELLERLGLEITEFGPDSVAVQRYPSLLAERKSPVEEFVRDLVDLLAEQAAVESEQLLQRIVATMACKAAIKAGDELTGQEMRELLARRGDVDRSTACPHGRPTSLTLSLADLEKQFHRT